MLNIHFQELKTTRLTLRRLSMEDLPLYFTRLAGNPRVTQYMLWKTHKSVDESVLSIQKALRRYETGEGCRWVIAQTGCGELVGIIDLIPLDAENGICSFAYMLGEDFWGKGYAAEALGAVLSYAFTHCRAETVVADHFAENGASGAVMQKAGMKLLGTIPRKYEKNGVLYDAPQYRITRTEWFARQSR